MSEVPLQTPNRTPGESGKKGAGAVATRVAALALRGSSNPPPEDVRFTLAERQLRLCHPKKGPTSRPDLSLLAGIGSLARL